MNPLSSIDGFQRPLEAERKLNSITVAAFGTPAGQELLDYLKSITINIVGGIGISNDHLRHMEGQRYIVSLLTRRIEQGHKEK